MHWWLSMAVSVANVAAFVILTLYIIAINRRQSLMTELQAFAVERDRAAEALSNATEVSEAIAVIASRVAILRDKYRDLAVGIKAHFPDLLEMPERQYILSRAARALGAEMMIVVEDVYVRWAWLQTLLKHAADLNSADPAKDEGAITDALDSLANAVSAAKEPVRLAVEPLKVRLEEADRQLQRVASILHRKSGIRAWWQARLARNSP